jgi:ubiquinone/menaquinone biosynthesis C-methylase UbiE
MHLNATDRNYVLGWSDAEQDRLIRQAMLLKPLTEGLFRDAGIARGQRVLDIGSGVGDVAMLAARLVGPSGDVVGIERDASSIARARARVAEAGLRNVSFTQTDVNQIVSDKPFDAAIGRLILTHLPDPAAVVRTVARLVAPAASSHSRNPRGARRWR